MIDAETSKAIREAQKIAMAGREPRNLLDMLFLTDCTLGDIVNAARSLGIETVPELAALRAESGSSWPEFIAEHSTPEA